MTEILLASATLNIILAIYIYRLVSRIYWLQSEAANMRIDAKLGDEVQRMRGEGLL